MRYRIYAHGGIAVMMAMFLFSSTLWADDRAAPKAPSQKSEAEQPGILPQPEVVRPKPLQGSDNRALPKKEVSASTPVENALPVQMPQGEPVDEKGAKFVDPMGITSGGGQSLFTDSNAATPSGPDSESPPALELPRVIEPKFSRSLTMIQAGHNDSNPMWSPAGDLLAFERGVNDKREIVITRRDGSVVKTIYFETPEEDAAMEFFFPGVTETASYNAGMSWSTDGRSLAFMSNGGRGNYDLYLLADLHKKATIRLTQHPEKDSHPHWSPMAGKIVFVSGRTGKADIFSMDLITRKTTRLTRGPKMYLYPQWSPSGKQIAMIYGSNENHDIYLIQNMDRPIESARALTTWDYDDLRPVWSPDGTKIAFYSNYNPKGDQKLWSIIVIAADGTDPTEGDGLAAKVVARQVIPDIEQGPAWMPDSRHIVFIKNDEQAFNPIYLIDIEDQNPIAVQTGTKMNHDVTCASDGTLAFRAQVDQWDHIYIAKLSNDQPLQGNKPPLPKEQP